MKRNYVSILAIASLFLMGMFASCTKEGPAGPPGKDGTNGTNGTNGTDGTTTCVECHSNNQAIFTRENQWAHSTHALGGNYERNEGECAYLSYQPGIYRITLTALMTGQRLVPCISNPNP